MIEVFDCFYKFVMIEILLSNEFHSDHPTISYNIVIITTILFCQYSSYNHKKDWCGEEYGFRLFTYVGNNEKEGCYTISIAEERN